jgi:predicted PurR-regulated permease PerM
VGALYFARSLLLPILLAFLFTLILSPVVRALKRRSIPESVTAFLLVLAVASFLGGGAYWLSAPVSKWVENAPEIGTQLRLKLMSLRKPVEKIIEAQKQVEDATTQKAAPGVQQVIVKEPGLISQAARGVPDFLASVGLFLVLLLFLLASGDMFYEKLVRVLPTLTDRKQGVRIARDIEQEISRYILTITAINAVLGAFVAGGLYLLGMPNPLLWGVVAAILNFIPYMGAITGVVVVGIIAIVSFPTLGQALLVPAVYLACTIIEGQFITPALVGRRMQINAIAILLAVAFWGWLWGVVGIFIAIPVLIVVKIFSDHVPGLGGLQEFLSPRGSEANQPD